MGSSKIEKQMGIGTYGSDTPGIGGRIKQLLEDFIVEEITPEGEILYSHLRELAGEENTQSNGPYTWFILEKHGWDTFDALRHLAKALNVDLERFSFAGMKDKRGITVQRASCWKVTPSELGKIVLKDMYLSGFNLSKKSIKLGDLWGNHFTITVRDIEPDVDSHSFIMETWNELETQGVPNFFGHQRFGTYRPITHLVGEYIIRGKFKDSVVTFLTEHSKHERVGVGKVRRRLRKTQDFVEAIEMFPRSLWYERTMLHSLAKNAEDYIGALRALPKRFRMMFVHAYQAYLFNRFLSERIKNNISLNQPVKGDIVRITSKDFPRYVKVIEQNKQEIDKMTRIGKAIIVLPLVGYSSKLPDGDMGEIVSRILGEEGVSTKDFRIERMRELSSSGEFRPIKLQVNKMVFSKPSRDDFNPKKTKVEFDFSLPKGCYATIVMREFMKSRDVIKAGY
ncbi:MAG: tRNA pseudouridine(13) synthase TruD [Candidatus Hodarchaeota archaeon]